MTYILSAVLLFVFTLLTPAVVSAISFKTSEVVRVEKDMVHDGTLVAAGEAIEIHGTVDGDLICATGKLRIYGAVNGDVICASQSISIDGRVNGNVRAAGQSLNLTGVIERNVLFFGQDAYATGGSQIDGELIGAGQSLRLDGTVGKNVWFAGEGAEVAGSVGKNVEVMSKSLQVAETAQVQGKVIFTSENKPVIASGSAIVGGLIQNKPPVKEKKMESRQEARKEWGSNLFYSIVSVFVVGLLLSLLMPKKSSEIMDALARNPVGSLGWGIVAMIMGPVLALILFVTIIGIPGGILLLLLWGLMLMAGVVYFTMYVGDKILETFVKDYNRSLLWSLLIGVPFTMLLFQIPVVGKLLMLVALWMGMGGLFQSFRPTFSQREEKKKAN